MNSIFVHFIAVSTLTNQSRAESSQKHAYVILTPPPQNHFYKVKLGFTGVYIIFFLFLLKNIDCEYSLEPLAEAVLTSTHNLYFWAEIWKLPEFFNWKFSIFVKFSIYLNWRVFVMLSHKGAMLRLTITRLSPISRIRSAVHQQNHVYIRRCKVTCVRGRYFIYSCMYNVNHVMKLYLGDNPS